MGRRWFASLVLLLAAGCGRGTYPVRGEVVFDDGSPARELAGYYVNFDSPELNVGANAVLGPDGTFELGTHKDGDGAPPGSYKVSICRPASDGDRPRMKLLIPARYESFETSGLTAEVKRQRNQVRLVVERLGGRTGQP